MEERGWRSGACGTPSLPAIKKPGLALFFYWLTGSGDGPLINLPLQPGDYFVRFKIMRFGEQSDAAERAPGFTANDADTFGDGWGTPDGPASPGLDGSGGRRTGKRSSRASLMMRACELSGNPEPLKRHATCR
jgi:hypothetical protein